MKYQNKPTPNYDLNTKYVAYVINIAKNIFRKLCVYKTVLDILLNSSASNVLKNFGSAWLVKFSNPCLVHFAMGWYRYKCHWDQFDAWCKKNFERFLNAPALSETFITFLRFRNSHNLNVWTTEMVGMQAPSLKWKGSWKVLPTNVL